MMRFPVILLLLLLLTAFCRQAASQTSPQTTTTPVMTAASSGQADSPPAGQPSPEKEPSPEVESPAATEPGFQAEPPVVAAPVIEGCPVFPANNIWNTPISDLPVHPLSDVFIAGIGLDTGLHPDFGSGLWDGGPIGIPYVTVSGQQPLVPIEFIWYGDESDPGPYPVPPDAPIEGGPDSDGDRHVLVIDRDNCYLYELYYAWPQANDSWQAGSGAVYDLNSHDLRPAGWTSADAAGLPIFPGLVRYEEVAAGHIDHALRFTVSQTRRAYVWPARHFASDRLDPTLPPMGLRFRLKASFDVSPYPPPVRVILNALKEYGMIIADNGSDWYISGAPDERWDNDMLVSALDTVHGSDFEAVDASSLMVDPDSGEARAFTAQNWWWLPALMIP